MSKKVLMIVLAVAFACAVLLYGHFRNNRPGKVNPARNNAVTGEKKKKLEQKVLSFSIDGRSPKGAKQWHLSGESAEIVGDEIHLKRLRAVAYSDNDTINLTADSGIYRKDPGEVVLIGNVKVLSDSGVILTTSRAKWSQDTKEISSDQEVNINKDNMFARGIGGMANSDSGKAVLDRDVSVIISPSTRVRCDGALNVDYNNNVAVFHDNVFVEDQEGKLFADKLTVEFDPKTKKLYQVIAEGNVKVKKGDSYAECPKAIYRDNTKSAKLIGGVRIVTDPEELKKLDNAGFDKKY